MYLALNPLLLICVLVKLRSHLVFSEQNIRTDVIMRSMDSKAFTRSISNDVQYSTHYMKQLCRHNQGFIYVEQKGTTSAGILELDVNQMDFPKFNCTVTIRTDRGYQLLLHPHSFNIGLKNRLPCVSFIEISEKGKILKKICNAVSKSPNYDSNVVSNENTVNVSYIKKSGNIKDELSLTFTAVGPRKVCYKSDKFLCKNNLCIDSHFICDGRNNCGDWSDELEPDPCRKKDEKKIDKDKPGKLPPGGIFGIVVAILISILFFAFFVIPYSKRLYVARRRRSQYSNHYQRRNQEERIYTIDGNDVINGENNQTQTEISRAASENVAYIEDMPPPYEEISKYPSVSSLSK